MASYCKYVFHHVCMVQIIIACIQKLFCLTTNFASYYSFFADHSRGNEGHQVDRTTAVHCSTLLPLPGYWSNAVPLRRRRQRHAKIQRPTKDSRADEVLGAFPPSLLAAGGGDAGGRTPAMADIPQLQRQRWGRWGRPRTQQSIWEYGNLCSWIKWTQNRPGPLLATFTFT